MRPAWKVAAGLVGGVLAAGAAAGARIARQRGRDPDSAPLAAAPPNRECTVTTHDGVPLSVAEVDPADGGKPDLTVVLVHGYTLDRRSWHFQRAALAGSAAPRVRQVLYDHRCHGRSGRGRRAAATIENLARDLDAVLAETAPDGPVVLLGHSMGGMTIMALAEQRPELFAGRIRGVALINTAAGDVGSSGLARTALSPRNPFPAWFGRFAAAQPGTVAAGRAAGDDVLWWLNKALNFADRPVEPAVIDLMHAMLSDTPVEVMTGFLPTLDSHNRYAALAGLRHVEVLVLGSDADRLTPYRHSQAIAALLPGAELVRVPNAGHMAMLEQPARVSDAVLGLVSRCASSVDRSRA